MINRFQVWHAADLVVSLVDNIQETFGLVIVEAMASGLPVVATDWNGYRDLVVDGETGFLVPTTMCGGCLGVIDIPADVRRGQLRPLSRRSEPDGGRGCVGRR